VLKLLLTIPAALIFLAIGYAIGRTQRPTNILKGLKLMFKVKADNPDVSYSIEVGEVQDSEGNVVPDAQLSIEVVSDNPGSVEVVAGADSKSGTLHFGAPGNANVTVTAKDQNGNTLGAGAAAFLITAGDPAEITSINLKVDGLTEEPSSPAPTEE
jgi:hypothetical protein